jgi:hypothetical protein
MRPSPPLIPHLQKRRLDELSELANTKEGKAALDAKSKSVFQHFTPGERVANPQGDQRRMTVLYPIPEHPQLKPMGQLIEPLLTSFSEALNLGNVRATSTSATALWAAQASNPHNPPRSCTLVCTGVEVRPHVRHGARGQPPEAASRPPH